MVDAFFENPVQFLFGDWRLRRYVNGNLQLENVFLLWTEIEENQEIELYSHLTKFRIYETTKAFSEAPIQFSRFHVLS